MTNVPRARDQRGQALTADQALALAQADAVQVYRDLSLYRIRVALERDGWHID